MNTPYKSGRNLIGPSCLPGSFDAVSVDCPFIFRHNGKYQMMYIGFDGIGYQTAIAESDDLIIWKLTGVILKRGEGVGWDDVGVAGTWIIKRSDNIKAQNARSDLKKIDGRYWMVYHSYPGEGYESGPARIGLAWSEDERLLIWNRLPEPVFSWENGETWENGGLYKACVVFSNGKYHMFYNAKDTEKRWVEQIGLATSDDLMNWTRYENNPVLKVGDGTWDGRFVSDPCVLRHGSVWDMFYYGFDNNHAQEGLAVSKDLRVWLKYPDPLICHGNQGEIDGLHAHKPAVIYKDGVLYHFYTAVSITEAGEHHRCITAATSEPVDF